LREENLSFINNYIIISRNPYVAACIRELGQHCVLTYRKQFHCLWKCLSQDRYISVHVYMCLGVVDCACFHNFSDWFWSCFDDVVFLVSHFITCRWISNQ